MGLVGFLSVLEDDMSESDLERTRECYRSDGYVSPLRVMSADLAFEYRMKLESIQSMYSDDAAATGQEPGSSNSFDDAAATGILTWSASIVLPFGGEIMCSPSLVDPVKAILGDDVLLMAASFFIKEPNSPAFISWHQDLTYWGYEDVSEVTAWVALTEASREMVVCGLCREATNKSLSTIKTHSKKPIFCLEGRTSRPTWTRPKPLLSRFSLAKCRYTMAACFIRRSPTPLEIVVSGWHFAT